MLKRFAQEEVEKLTKSLKTDETGLILTSKVHDFVNRTQLICEGSHFSMREYNLKLDDVINDQRNVIYKLRNNLLQEDTNMIEIIIPMIDHAVEAISKQYLVEGMLPEEWDFASLTASLNEILSVENMPSLSANNVHSPEDLQSVLKETLSLYKERVNELDSNTDLQQSLRYVALHF